MSIPMPLTCDLCEEAGYFYEGYDVKYCSVCGQFLCDACRKNPARRFKGMIKKHVLGKKIGGGQKSAQ